MKSVFRIFCWYVMSGICSFGMLHSQQIDVRDAVEDLTEFIAIPNFGLNASDIDRNIEWLEDAFHSRDIHTEILETSGNPLLLATWNIQDDLPTVLFYMHLDGQPVDPSRWNQKDPYGAVIKRYGNKGWEVVSDSEVNNKLDSDWRIFGRSASDDKGPIIAFLHAIDHLKEKGLSPSCNIKVILDTEEEIGSKPIAAAVQKYRDKLSADALIINDGPVHLSGHPTLTFGCRGITTLNMTVYGPIRPQHSGHYGNYAPNPVFRMARLLSSMKDEEGRVVIDGYYEGIDLDDNIKSSLALVPDDIEGIHELLQIKIPEKVGANYQESLQYPSLNARGIAAGWVGQQARTIVPDYATVAIDIRLVPESDPIDLIEKITAHIEGQGYHIVDHEPTYEERRKFDKILFLHHSAAWAAPFRTDMNSPIGHWLRSVVRETFDQDPVQIRIMGGTVPIASFINELNIPAVIVPMVNADNNQHSPNENLRIGHLEYAIKLFSGILSEEVKLD